MRQGKQLADVCVWLVAEALPEGVAQNFILLYRRFSICAAPAETSTAGFAEATQAASLRYRRLKTCAAPSGEPAVIPESELGCYSSFVLNTCSPGRRAYRGPS